MGSELGNPVVSYSIRDLFERLESKLDTKFAELTVAVSRKAEASDLAQVIATQINHTDRITDIENAMRNQREASGWKSEWRRWLTTALLTAALVAVSIFQMVHG